MSAPTVKSHYSIVGNVPFLNVAIHQDNELFLDPSAIRNGADPMSRRAHRLLLGFASELLRCRRSSNPTEQAKGLAMLQHLHEPNETRLGMSRHGAAGHGFGEGLGTNLWDELGSNPACRTAALTRLEDLRLFIDGVGNDLISDLTTRVVFEVLADFTHRMTTRFPSLAVGQTTATVDLWKPATHRWTPTAVTLPFVAPHQLLLVPKSWVYWRTLMDPTAFYNHFGTGTVQVERTTVDHTGKMLAPSKAALKKEFRHVRGLNIQQAAKYIRDGDDLVARYREQVDREFEPLDDDELDDRLK